MDLLVPTLIMFGIPACLTVWHLVTFVQFKKNKAEKKRNRIIEAVAIVVGGFFTLVVVSCLGTQPIDWDEALRSDYLHAPVNTEHFTTVAVLAGIGLLSYLLLRWIPLNNQPPLFSAVGIAGMYIGAFVCVMWCLQMPPALEDINFSLLLFPANLILLYVKTILIVSLQKNREIQNGETQTRFTYLSKLLNRSANLPWVALLILIPLLGLIVLILTLFGQSPDSMIRAWTETAGWTLSQKVAPPDVPYDGHYLCTVAATGHRSIVKPLRTGVRNGHRVLVNRQLCIANAFEDVLHEKAPRLHKAVRNFYDKTGYPISKHIHSKYIADVIYWGMKPLEWIFLIILYAADVKPENRIAVQYPHALLPDAVLK